MAEAGVPDPSHWRAIGSRLPLSARLAYRPKTLGLNNLNTAIKWRWWEEASSRLNVCPCFRAESYRMPKLANENRPDISEGAGGFKKPRCYKKKQMLQRKCFQTFNENASAIYSHNKKVWSFNLMYGASHILLHCNDSYTISNLCNSKVWHQR